MGRIWILGPASQTHVPTYRQHIDNVWGSTDPNKQELYKNYYFLFSYTRISILLMINAAKFSIAHSQWWNFIIPLKSCIDSDYTDCTTQLEMNTFSISMKININQSNAVFIICFLFLFFLLQIFQDRRKTKQRGSKQEAKIEEVKGLKISKRVANKRKHIKCPKIIYLFYSQTLKSLGF